MEIEDATVAITGAGGLIGSAMCRRLSAPDIVAIDNFSKGRREWIPDGPEVREADLTDPEDVEAVITDDIDLVVHLAARSDANDADPRGQYEDNVAMVYNLLERLDEIDVDNFAFASSSAVYGEAPRPTPEDYAPLEPTSEYGASKLACEGVLSTYAHSYGLNVWQFRFANVIGLHQRGNVVPDFVEKLLDDGSQLHILGNGRQEKSYVHVDDCVDAMLHVVQHTDPSPLTTFNIGTATTTTVTQIAEVVSDVMGLDPEFVYEGGERGWTGDVPRMKLSTSKIGQTGWSPAHSSEEAIRRAAEELYEELR
ncbi:NAD-dependent epimerase/dehydratase family protein [Halorussus halophilus]|uniref:NAD-dependent epimerase/dehydratase family protein n=1 Tax=Halorussus halophilus TaxID=2650975 RepID=UPI0013016A8E|nr:NAD-dependent epimerase/dehydratase family protein [Halorussus halophilus]